METVSKQDRHGVRTATDIERKYNFTKRFAEVTGIATDARSLAEKTAERIAKLEERIAALEAGTS